YPDKPVLISKHELSRRIYDRGSGSYGGNLAFHRSDVVVRERACGARAHSGPSEEKVSGHHIHHVRAHTTDLIQDHRLCTLADRHGYDTAAHADNDAQHRKCRS